MTERLYLAAMPQIDSEGKCRAFTLMRPDGKHLTPTTLNKLRQAMGQQALNDDEIDSYHVPDWEEIL